MAPEEELKVYKRAFGLACKRLGVMSDETGVCDAAAAFCEKSCRRAGGLVGEIIF